MRFLRVVMPAVAIVLLIPAAVIGGPAVHPVAEGCGAVTVTAVTPNSGPTAGGTNVTITGTNFFAPLTVTFAGVAATNVVVVNSTTITATTPPGAAGAADVLVTVTSCGVGGLPAGFTYTASTAVPALSPLALALLAVSLGLAAVFVMRR